MSLNKILSLLPVLGLITFPLTSDESVESASAIEEIVVTARKREESLLDIPESITFSPHLENASIMKLIIMIITTLCFTQLFISYRSHIYRLLDKFQSNKMVKTTIQYVF